MGTATKKKQALKLKREASKDEGYYDRTILRPAARLINHILKKTNVKKVG